MEDMNGTIVVKTQRTLNLMEKTKRTTAAGPITRIIAHVKTDAPKKMDVKLLAHEAIAELESQTVIMNITTLTNNGKPMKELQVQKY